jgi:sugar lactone lactonase YvrE
MIDKVFDATQCQLGEGPLWHPERQQLFWFDVTKNRLHTKLAGKRKTWQFNENTSAAGWVDKASLMLASETGLYHFDIVSGKSELLCKLEAGQAGTRSNDGRADPYGGFWIGTMGKGAEARAGAIYRYYRGEVRRLYSGITIPNAICFSPDGLYAYFTDTLTRIIQRQKLSSPQGWPVGDPTPFIDLRFDKLNPDGAVVDVEGHIWNAQWGAGRVAEYDAKGKFLRSLAIPAIHSSCPAFGGVDLTTLFCTTAQQGHAADELLANPNHGKTFMLEGVAKGQKEHRVIL